MMRKKPWLSLVWCVIAFACSSDDAAPPAKPVATPDASATGDGSTEPSLDASSDTDAPALPPSKFPAAPFLSIEIVLAGTSTTAVIYDPLYPSGGQCDTSIIGGCLARSCPRLIPGADGGVALPPFAKGTISITNVRTGQIVAFGTNAESTIPGYAVYSEVGGLQAVEGDVVRVQWINNDQLPPIDWETTVPPSVAMAIEPFSRIRGAPMAWVRGPGTVRLRLAQFDAGFGSFRRGFATCLYDRMLGEAILPEVTGNAMRVCDATDGGINLFNVAFASGAAQTTVIAGPPNKVLLTLASTAQASRVLSCAK